MVGAKLEATVRELGAIMHKAVGIVAVASRLIITNKVAVHYNQKAFKQQELLYKYTNMDLLEYDFWCT